jgi:hypothetical protein
LSGSQIKPPALPEVRDYVDDCLDRCVKEMFSRFVKSDGEVTAVFPFHRLQHSFAIGAGYEFDPEKQKSSNNNVRQWIQNLKERVLLYADKTNPDAMRKTEHYLNALTDQLANCDKTDEVIAMLSPYLAKI